MAHHTDPRAPWAERDTGTEAVLEALHGRSSVEELAREALGMMTDNAEYYTRSVRAVIRDNPVGVALTAAGVAWLVFGGRKQTDGADDWDRGYRRTAGTAPYSGAGHAARRAGPGSATEDESWTHRIDDQRRRASGLLRRLEEEARHYAGELGDYAAERGRILSDFAADMRESLRHGLDDLTEAARDRVVVAREKAYAARLRVQRGAREGGREMLHQIEEHPVVAGVVAMSLGATFAALLPRTRIEDRTFGAESDRLMAAAADLLREERVRLTRVAEGVADEVRTAAKDAADAAVAGVQELGADVRDRAEQEATRDQDEGKT